MRIIHLLMVLVTLLTEKEVLSRGIFVENVSYKVRRIVKLNISRLT